MNLTKCQDDFVQDLRKLWVNDPMYSRINASPPGTGKTRAVLAARLARPSSTGKCLIIGKKGQGDYWSREWAKVSSSTRLVHDLKRMDWDKDNLVFTHVGQLQCEFRKCYQARDSTSPRDKRAVEYECGIYMTPFQRSHSPFYSTHWDLVIVDESMFLKHPFWLVLNDTTKHLGQRACYAIRYESCLLMNGTLVSTKVMDLAGQVHMLMRHRSRTIVDSHDDTLADAQYDVRYRRWWHWIMHPRQRERLRTLMEMWVYGNSVELVLEAARDMDQVELEYETIELESTPVQDELLRLIRQHVQQNPGQTMAKIPDLIMAQIAPQLVFQCRDTYPKHFYQREWILSDSPKLHELVLHTLPSLFDDEEEGSRQVLIFSRFHAALDLLEYYLAKHYPRQFQNPIARIRAGQTTKERSTLLDEFNKDRQRPRWDQQCMMMTFHSCTALNLQVANAIVVLDQPCTLHEYNQMIGRCRRMGQKRDKVSVINMTLQNPSTDKWCMELQNSNLRQRMRVHIVDATDMVVNKTVHDDRDSDEEEEEVPGKKWFRFLFPCQAEESMDETKDTIRVPQVEFATITDWEMAQSLEPLPSCPTFFPLVTPLDWDTAAKATRGWMIRSTVQADFLHGKIQSDSVKM